MMTTITSSLADLNQVKAEFQAWRKRHLGCEQVPEQLWTAAI
ncbi:MAG: hypothetical protein AB1489_19155 [Acidobacteriota bacterium]